MPRLLHINIGFITNSSSVVYHFPKELLKNKDIQAFLRAYEVEDGFVGDDLWHRARCGTVAITKEQKMLAQSRLKEAEYSDFGHPPHIDVDDDATFVVVIGDEHFDIANALSHMLQTLSEKMGVRVLGADYN